MTQWNEADHPRDDKGRFTESGGETSASENNEDNMRNRADLLFPNTQDSQTQKYFDIKKETDQIKKYENIGLGNFEYNLRNKSVEVAQKWTPESNTKFSDSAFNKAKEFIRDKESFRAIAYKPTPNDVLTIGYGHTGKVDGKPITEGMIITKAKAEELYLQDFKEHIKPLKLIKVPLSDNEKIALSSLIYNIGGTKFIKSGIIEKLNNGDKKGAFNEFDKYVTQKGVVLNGLVKRRKLEKELALTPDE